MEKQPTVFVDGLLFKKRREKAPEWIKGHASMKIADFIAWLKIHGKGKEWINFDLCQSAKGSLYFKLDTFTQQRPEEKHTTELDTEKYPPVMPKNVSEDASYQDLYNSF